MNIETRRKGKIRFTLDLVEFQYDVECCELHNITAGKRKSSISIAFTHYLVDLLDVAPNVVDFNNPNSEVYKLTHDKSDPRHDGPLGKLRELFRHVMPVDYPKLSNRAWPINVAKGKYWLQAEVIKVSEPRTESAVSSNDLTKDYAEWNKNVEIAEKNMPQLMNVLVELYPELDDFFHRLNDGSRLPFHILNEEQYGRPKFPIEVEDYGPKEVRRERGDYSIRKQRDPEGARLFNGSIYRLTKATKSEWTIARGDYYTSLESCDYLRREILRLWGECVLTSDVEQAKLRIRSSPAVAEWLANIRQIRKKGDFTGYCAGMAFTMPVFYSQGSKLTLVCARGSTKKATGGGKYHCCPAGMLEYYRNTRADFLEFNDLRTYMIKELIEETMADEEFVEKDIQARLNARDMSRGDGLNLRRLERMFEKLSSKWQKNGDFTELFDLARKFKEPEFHPYFVLDAFRLRPELIKPVYFKDQIQIFLNWEYDGKLEDARHYRSIDDLQKSLKEEAFEWAEPGLAAALLGGERWFEKQHS